MLLVKDYIKIQTFLIICCIIRSSGKDIRRNNTFNSRSKWKSVIATSATTAAENQNEPNITTTTANPTLFLYKLPPNYNKYELPTKRDSVTKQFIAIPVDIGVLIQSFRGFDEVNQKITLELDLATAWIDFTIQSFDKRNATVFEEHNGVPYIALDSSFLDNIWWPDIMFSDVISIIKPNTHETKAPRPVQLRIYPEGKMKLYTRIVATIYCPMDFKYYPADTQTCLIKLRSYSLSISDIILEWDNLSSDNEKYIEAAYLLEGSDASFDFSIHDVKNTTYKPVLCPKDDDAYTYLQFSISGRRKLSFHMLQTFLPSVLLVSINCLSFCVPVNYLEARIGISMTTLLTLTAMFSSIKEYTPQVSYVKAIDIWMLACIVIVFATLVEFSVLIWLNKSTEKKIANNTIKRKTINRKIYRQTNINVETEMNAEEIKRFCKRMIRTAERRGFFIVVGSFIVFNIIFWLWLILCSKYYSYTVDYRFNAIDK